MSPEALFRFRIVSAVDACKRWNTARPQRCVGSQPKHTLSQTVPRQISESTIWRWLRAVDTHGISGLEPASRPTNVGSRVLSEEFEDSSPKAISTRRILGTRVTTSENAVTVLHILARVLRQYGRFDRVYCDKGPGFRADDVEKALAALKIPLLLGRAYYPQGRGKIERFNRSLGTRLLRGLGRGEVDPDCSALTLRRPARYG